ncbi:hypothetical protein HDV00_010221 [Rhizophlyctis rosea]|nr:hypothetical protein HDV00_010221 [Rhizophlyctis rosea]
MVQILPEGPQIPIPPLPTTATASNEDDLLHSYDRFISTARRFENRKRRSLFSVRKPEDRSRGNPPRARSNLAESVEARSITETSGSEAGDADTASLQEDGIVPSTIQLKTSVPVRTNTVQTFRTAADGSIVVGGSDVYNGVEAEVDVGVMNNSDLGVLSNGSSSTSLVTSQPATDAIPAEPEDSYIDLTSSSSRLLPNATVESLSGRNKGKGPALSIRTNRSHTGGSIGLPRHLTVSSIQTSRSSKHEIEERDPEMVALARELLEVCYREAEAERLMSVARKRTTWREKGREQGGADVSGPSALDEVVDPDTVVQCPICTGEYALSEGYVYHDGCRNGTTCGGCAIEYVRSCLGDVAAQFPIKCPLCLGNRGSEEGTGCPLADVVRITTELTVARVTDGGLTEEECDAIWRHTNLKDLLVEQGHWFCPKCERLSLREDVGAAMGGDRLAGGGGNATGSDIGGDIGRDEYLIDNGASSFFQRVRGIFLPTRRPVLNPPPVTGMQSYAPPALTSTPQPKAKATNNQSPPLDARVQCPYCEYIHCDALKPRRNEELPLHDLHPSYLLQRPFLEKLAEDSHFVSLSIPEKEEKMVRLQPEGAFDDGLDPGSPTTVRMKGGYKYESVGKVGQKEDKWRDARNMVLLVFLYLLQGVPLGLTMGSVPFLLKSKMSFGELAVFSLSSYPYSLKLLWSPIVDSVYFPSIGRRKSWIVPIQALLGISMLVLGGSIDEILTQTIGLNTGYFLSFTVFLALNSSEFCNSYLRSVPATEGIIPLGSYLQFWGLMFLVCDAWLIFLQKEEHDSEETIDEIKTVYKTIWDVCKMPHMRQFILVLFVAKIGFIANEAVTPLKLIDKGLKKEDLALSVLIDFPFQILFGYYAAKWSSGDRPLRPV